MGYEVLIWWILMVWVVLGRELQSAMRRPVYEIDAIRQRPAGLHEYLLSIPVSIAAPLQWQVFGNRQPRRGKQRNLTGVVSYPDDLLRFQVRRLTVS